jgi:hypothetical protein
MWPAVFLMEKQNRPVVHDSKALHFCITQLE